jgi:hypothetical protein
MFTIVAGIPNSTMDDVLPGSITFIVHGMALD